MILNNIIIGQTLRSAGASMDNIASLMGHAASNRITAAYAKYDPQCMGNVPELLSVIWNKAIEHADLWRATHYRDMKTNCSCGVLKHENGEPVRPLCEEYFARLDLHDYWAKISKIDDPGDEIPGNDSP